MLAVTLAGRQTHAHVNIKESIDLNIVRSPEITALYIIFEEQTRSQCVWPRDGLLMFFQIQ